MIHKEDLLAAGYKAFPWHDELTGNVIYCRIVRGDHGLMLYQIDARILLYSRTVVFAGSPDATSISVRLYLPDCPVTGRGGFEFEPLLEPDATIDQVEALIASVYERLGCVPDLLNN